MREHLENGRTYPHELAFGDPVEPYRNTGLALAGRLEDGVTGLLTQDDHIDAADAATPARVITAMIHLSLTATVYLHRSDEAVVADIRDQIHATGPHDHSLHERPSNPREREHLLNTHDEDVAPGAGPSGYLAAIRAAQLGKTMQPLLQSRVDNAAAGPMSAADDTPIEP